MGRSAGSALMSSGALALALTLSSCGGAGSDSPGSDQETPDAQPVTTTSSAAPEPTAAPTPAGSATPAPQPSSGPSGAADPSADGAWTTYSTADGSLAFDHPEDWTVTDAAGAPQGGVSVVIGDGTGRDLATLQTNLVTGAVCPAEMPYSLLDSEPLPALAQETRTPRFVFEGRMDPSETDPMLQNTLVYGITSAPEPTGGTACPIAHFFSWPPSGAAFTGIYDPFAVYPGQPMHVDTPHAYMETEEYQDIRAMITSLRPAS
ncbi:hypothetical protein FJV46_09050 [Arthrobacter agilis]|uniref:hypothetical protein n=1 Tax=Arthrobacter agilis TaxID=37921 RepID=UPI000B34AAE8|nr:hypothetical protein [Arthrobacter agilis]OUM43588.1 hypothetical protein B8W74_05290 [Arthrobacter agilis]PPB46825.1 hypothetical protein CI784_06100 [Arthrobacter agilis]TPV24835.1 hypothetical protein FJV46_09050 [Arthrobacter agilis]VDR30982.1 Uncharacterised protein [Arthrobacter agilis]